MRGRDEHGVSQEHWGVYGPDGNEFNATFPTRAAAREWVEVTARLARMPVEAYTLWCTRGGDCRECRVHHEDQTSIVRGIGERRDGLFVITKSITATIRPVRSFEALLGGRSGQRFPHTIRCELLTDSCDQMHEPCVHCWKAKLEDL